MTYILKALPILLATLAFAAPRLAFACHNVTFCLKWQPHLIDEGFGDAYPVAGHAYGAKFTLIRPAPEPPLSGFLGDDGCMTFETQFAYGHKVVVYAEALIGTPAVHIRAFKRNPDLSVEPPPAWIIDLHGLAADDIVEQTLPVEKSEPFSSLMAVTTHVMSRFSHLDVMPPADASHTLDILYEEWSGNAYYSSPDDPEVPRTLHVGVDSSNEKFVIAHEMGHWLLNRWGWGSSSNSVSGNTDYDYPVVDDQCQFGVIPFKVDGVVVNGLANKHGIRSAEYSLPAMDEGLAHFIASVVFNDVSISDGDGIFRYYKDINVGVFDSYQDFVMNSSRVSLLGTDDLGGETRWTANQCSNDWAEDGVSSEIDWMRFYWRFLTKTGVTKPTLQQILSFFADAESNKDFYELDKLNIGSKLEEIMSFSAEFPFTARYREANCAMGVYNVDTCDD